MASPRKSEQLRAQLSELGRRRDEQATLGDDIRAAVAAARQEGIAMTEIANLLRLDRSTVYRVYCGEPVR